MITVSVDSFYNKLKPFCRKNSIELVAVDFDNNRAIAKRKYADSYQYFSIKKIKGYSVLKMERIECWFNQDWFTSVTTC